MDRKNIIRISLTITLLVAVTLIKLHYSRASVDELRWILAPTAKLVSYFRGVTYSWEAGEGYINRNELASIVKGCAGVNYMITLILIFAAPLILRVNSFKKGVGVMVLSAILAYLLTTLINSLRITISIDLYMLPIYSGSVTKELVHTITGVVVYFGALLMMFEPISTRLYALFIGKDVQKRGVFIPISGYLLITLIVPILNNISIVSSFHFWWHQLIVLTTLSLLYLLYRVVVKLVLRVHL